MPQTFLALVGVIIASTLSLAEQRHHALTVTTMVHVESELAAMEAAENFLDDAVRLPFDDATVSDAALTPLALASHLPIDEDLQERFDNASVRSARRSGLGSVFGSGASDRSVSDADGATMTVTRQAGEGTWSFQIESVVGYVSEADGSTPSAIPTKMKQISVRVTPLDVAGADGVVLSRVVTCNRECAW